jgi:hypothetical protein
VTSTIQSNIFQGTSSASIIIKSNLTNTIQQNTFTNLQQQAIIFDNSSPVIGQSIVVHQNYIEDVCISGSVCFAIGTNNLVSPGMISATISQNIINNVGSVS